MKKRNIIYKHRFFNNKLPFLDPDNKKQISLGQAISLLKFSGLPPMMQKKILDNLKLTGIVLFKSQGKQPQTIWT